MNYSPHCDSFIIHVVTSPTTVCILVVSLVHSRLDYGNFVFVGLPAYLQRRLQMVLNAAARLIIRLRCYDHVSDALAILHWLCLPGRVNFKLSFMAYQVLNGMAPPSNSFRYLACQVVAVCGRRSRCSCTSRRTVCQQPAVARFLSHPPFLEHSVRRLAVCTVCLFLSATAKDILVSPVISGHFSLNFCTTFLWTLQQFRLF